MNKRKKLHRESTKKKKKKRVDMINSARVSLKDTASSRKPATYSSHIKSEQGHCK